RVELGADLVLARRSNLVMEHLDFDALLLERERDRVADVLQGVDRRHRKIAAFDGSAMRHVAAFVFLARRPWRLLRLDLDETAGHVDTPGDRVEDEELRLGTEIRGIAEAGGFEICLGALGKRARGAVVALPVGRFDYLASAD